MDSAIKDAVLKLAKKAGTKAEAGDAGDVMKYSQAALNLAHTGEILARVEKETKDK